MIKDTVIADIPGWLEAEVQRWLQRRIEASRSESDGVGATFDSPAPPFSARVFLLTATFTARLPTTIHAFISKLITLILDFPIGQSGRRSFKSAGRGVF